MATADVGMQSANADDGADDSDSDVDELLLDDRGIVSHVFLPLTCHMLIST